MNSNPTHRDLHEATCDRLHRVQGLAYALYDRLTEAHCIKKPDPQAEAIFALADTLNDTIAEVIERHGKEWHAAPK